MIRMRGAAEREIIIMKYAIIGAGGTGGILGFYMTKAGKDVTLIARGRHLAAMQESGLAVEKMWDGTTETIPVKAADMDHYSERPDVILVCVKGYSLEDTIPFIQRVENPSTIVIPVLNIYGTGAKMQEKLPNLLVTDGCIYVSANIKEPGVLIQHGKILRVVYGVREKEEYDPRLEKSNRILMSVELTAYCLKISVGMLWRNFPMYLPSVRRDFTIMPRQRTFREKGRNGKLSRP